MYLSNENFADSGNDLSLIILAQANKFIWSNIHALYQLHYCPCSYVARMYCCNSITIHLVI